MCTECTLQLNISTQVIHTVSIIETLSIQTAHKMCNFKCTDFSQTKRTHNLFKRVHNCTSLMCINSMHKI